MPYRVDGGKTYFERREVDDALLCLRAVDDPSDGPAVYGALHSTFFGFTDDELFLFWAAGGRFDLFAEPQPEAHPARLRSAGACCAICTACGLRSEPHELLAGPHAAHARRRRARGDRSGRRTGHRQPRAARRARARLRRRRRRRPGGVPRLGRRGRRCRRRAGVPGGRRGRPRPPAHHPQGQGARVPHRGRLRRRPGRRRRRRRAHRRPRAAERRRAPQGGAARLGGADARDARLHGPRGAREAHGRERAATSPVRGDHAGEGPPGHQLLRQPGDQEGRPREGGSPRAASPPCCQSRRSSTRSTRTAGCSCCRRRWPRRATTPTACPAPIGCCSSAPRGGSGAGSRLLRGLRARAPRRARAASSTWTSRSATGGPGAPAGRARALALGSAVHRIMELCDLGDESSLAAVATSVAAELERPDLAGEAAALALACWRAAPVRAAADAAAQSEAVHRELHGRIRRGRRHRLRRHRFALPRRRRLGRGRLQDRPRRGAGRAPEPLPAAGRRLRPRRRVGARRGQRPGGVLRRRQSRTASVVSVPVDDELRAEALREIRAAADAGRALRPDELAAEE